jgi:uncharacterized protein with GYD domain
MATYVSLVSFTDQGIRSVKESPNRAEAFQALAAKVGVQVKTMLWTVGAYDVVTITEGPEEAQTALLLAIGSLGNVRTQTLRGYSAAEFKKIIAQMPST